MNAIYTPPTPADAMKPPVIGRTPVFSTATFYPIKPPATAAALPESGARSTPAAASGQQENKLPVSTWRRHIGSARLTWSKLSSGELERIEGNPAKLSILLLRHNSFDRREAELQVKNFFHRNRV